MPLSFRFSLFASLRHFLPAVAFLLLSLAPTGAGALELVMFGRTGCVWCARWERDIGRVYPNADEGRAAPLRRMDIRDQRRLGADLDQPVVYTPTFVLIDEGVEVGRITGYQGEEMFWATLDEMLTQARPRRRY